ncbi:1-acyl-sn-glycerol-3-phosphate acyltransferase alpha-like [Cimex lectularius]|uniref:1-acylglycerol-3-phosphate O-acyltransferase n=1 Tax=Cimex lectularius TaxID=79782 RepID=A0A8I6STK1_CIMLE|nr:1-acyl-sn-glycerol-3-phosphate acyltransferase alpha-like [Cimex lectularius]
MSVIWILVLIIFILDQKSRKFSYCVRWVYFLTLCLIAGTVAFPYFVFKKNNPRNLWMFGHLSDIIFWLMGIQFELRSDGKSKVDGHGIIVVNHQSTIDALCSTKMYRHYGDCVGVARKEIKYLGLMGPSMVMGGYIFINRGNKESAIKEISKGIANHLRNYKDGKVIIFPEGTRNKIGSEFLPFKKGAFRAAIDNQVPIFPCVISPLNFIKKDKYFNKGKIIVTQLEPIPTVGMTAEDIDSLIEKTRNVMAIEYKKLGDELYPKSL